MKCICSHVIAIRVLATKLRSKHAVYTGFFGMTPVRIEFLTTGTRFESKVQKHPFSLETFLY